MDPRSAPIGALLEAHRSADALEEAHRQALLAHINDPRPFDRDTWTPGHFTASAFVLSPESTQLLLLLHTKLGIWVQPGGHFEPEDQDLLTAATREVGEETGLFDLELCNPLLDVDVHTIPARKGDPQHQHLDLRLLFRARSLELQATEEMQQWCWVPLAEVAQTNTDESVRRVARRLLQA